MTQALSFFFSFFLFFSTSISFLFSAPYETLLEKGKLPLLTPIFKERKTAKIRLSNGLEAYLISDPHLQQSGAMLSVKTGSWEDPEEAPGLAHFLEHMLFLGTKEYPKESEYTQFIAEHGGQTNAFTSSNATSFIFTVHNQAFTEAVARFSRFFQTPLFNASGVSRELKSIDQEYAKNLQSDDVRELYVIKELVPSHHPFHGFSMGNSQTLSSVSRDTLMEWYQKHYSAHLMRLVVYSSLPIEQLKNTIVTAFETIPSHDKAPFITDQTALAKLEDKFVYIEPIKEIRSLTLLWELPPKFANMPSKRPEELIAYVLGHEGEKSLLAQLKRENLAEGLAASGVRIGDHLMFFMVHIDLTSEGIKDIDHVATRCFQAIKQLQKKGIPLSLFEEIQTMNRIEYQYQLPEQLFLTLMKHGNQIHNTELSSYPEQLEVLQEFDPQAIQEMIAAMSPEKATFFIRAPSKLTLVKPDRKEKWLGVEYAIRPIPKEFMAKWKTQEAHPEIDLPPPNSYIPENLNSAYTQNTLYCEELPQPKLLINDSISTFYFAPDTVFGVPKSIWTMQVKTPQITLEDPSKVVLADLYIKFMEDSLNKSSYPAQMAGLNYQIKRVKNGLQITVEGYSEHTLRLFEQTIKQMTLFEPNLEKFKLFKDSLARQYQNFYKEMPLEQSLELFKTLLYQDFVPEKEKITALRKITFKQFNDWYAELFNKTFLEGLFFGNTTEEEARAAMDLARTIFYKGIYPQSEQFKQKALVLPQNEGPYYLESITKSQGNAVLLAIENSQFSFKERGVQQILMQAIEDPFFAALRTKQQTGYLVYSFPEEVERKLFNIFAVQSNTHDARDLLSRFETFIEDYLQEMGKSELSEEQFENIRASLIKKLQEPAKNTKEMGELLYLLAFEYNGDFQWMNKRIDAMQALSYREFMDLAKMFLGKQNRQRLGILVKGEIPKEHHLSYTRAQTWNAIRKISRYACSEQ